MGRKVPEDEKGSKGAKKKAKRERKTKKATPRPPAIPSSPSAIAAIAQSVVTAMFAAQQRATAQEQVLAESARSSSSSSSSTSSSSSDSAGGEAVDLPTTSSRSKKKAAAQLPKRTVGGKGKKQGSSSGAAPKKKTSKGGKDGGKVPPAKKRGELCERYAGGDAWFLAGRSTPLSSRSKRSHSPSPTTRDDLAGDVSPRARDSGGRTPRVKASGGPADDVLLVLTPLSAAAAQESAAPPRKVSARGQSGSQTQGQSGVVKGASEAGRVQFNHLSTAFILPSNLADTDEMDEVTVIGETEDDPAVHLLNVERLIPPNPDNLDGLINLSRLTQAARFKYVRRLTSAAQFNLPLRANVRLCMLVNARGYKDIFYLVLRNFDMEHVTNEKTTSDNFLTQVFNYLEILFAQRWFLMRPGKLTNTELPFYGQRAENFKRYLRYVELFFVRPKEFYTLLATILETGDVGGQEVPAEMLERFGQDESNLRAWFAMQMRACDRIQSTRRFEMDVIPDESLSWIAQRDPQVEQVLRGFLRSFNNVRGTTTEHWLDAYPPEQELAPSEFTELLYNVHTIICRKIRTNKAFSISSRRLALNVAPTAICGEYVTSLGTDEAMRQLATQIGGLQLDSAELELSKVSEDIWTAKFRFAKVHDVAETSGIEFTVPLSNTEQYKNYLLKSLYSQYATAAATDGDAASAASLPQPQPTGQVVNAGAQTPVELDLNDASRASTPSDVMAELWSTRPLSEYWERPSFDMRREEASMVFCAPPERTLESLRTELRVELEPNSAKVVETVENENAATLLHEAVSIYLHTRPHDVVVVAADGFWQPELDVEAAYAPITLTTLQKKPVAFHTVRCLAGFTSVGDQRALCVVFQPNGLRLAARGLPAHCTILLLGYLHDAAAVQRAFVAAQVQIARALCTSQAELESSHWAAPNCVPISVTTADLEDESANVILTQQFLRLLLISVLPNGPLLRLSSLDALEDNGAFLKVIYARLETAQVMPFLKHPNPAERKWRKELEQHITSALSSTLGSDLLDLNEEYNTETFNVFLRTVLLWGRADPYALTYLTTGRVSTEFGAASGPLLQAHTRDCQRMSILAAPLEFRLLTKHGYVHYGSTKTTWLFQDEDGAEFTYNPLTQAYWRDGVSVQREALFDNRKVNLPYMK